MSDTVSRAADSQQVPGTGRALYGLKHPEDRTDSALCWNCGIDIVCIGGRWLAREARWPNLAHCYYDAGDGGSRGHSPE